VIYLCGPINGRTDADCMDWRATAKSWLAATKDPMDRDYRGRELEPGIAAEIVENDKADIRGCRGVLVFFDKPSVGTAMEVLFAYDHGIPVHVVNASDKPLSPWLIYHATTIHQTLEAACAAVEA
jgi:nucleoside 2-deoxyribosyltransferase